jgi:AcrR family transcriptional regulator
VPSKTATARPSLREDQRRVTRLRLLDAAGEAFAEQGFARTTLDDVATRAGVNRGTVYLHFRDKPEHLMGLLRAIDTDYETMFEQLRGARTRAEQIKFFKGMLKLGSNLGPAFAAAREAAAADPDVQTWITEHQRSHSTALARVLEAHEVAPRAAAARALALTAMFTEIIGATAAGDLGAPKADVLDAIVDLYRAAATP